MLFFPKRLDEFSGFRMWHGATGFVGFMATALVFPWKSIARGLASQSTTKDCSESKAMAKLIEKTPNQQ